MGTKNADVKSAALYRYKFLDIAKIQNFYEPQYLYIFFCTFAFKLYS